MNLAKLAYFLAPSITLFVLAMIFAFVQPQHAELPVNMGVEGWMLVLFGAAVGALIQAGFVLFAWNIQGRRDD